ncbi:MAG: LPS-assembly protein LptD, partial [Bacteroidales bacterium]|nr:LPS-assembly protein LptD [Bacteroidales bacterium]
MQDSVPASALIDAEDSVITIRTPENRKDALTAPVRYKASDSIRLVLDSGLVHMYRNCQLSYEKITMEADYVRIIFDDKLLFARGLPDSTGKMAGNPRFSEGGEEFRAREMHYNFDSKKGLIYQVITQEGDGFLHGELIKKLPNDIINIKHGKYTTCSLDHPHFEFRFSRSKVIPDNKIITGPAYLVIADVPTPLLIPFGLFPNKKGQRSGILIPTYGESANRGFYFENFGYYLGINEFLDLELRGDIYTRGSWAVKTKTNYNVRYKYRGSLGLRYAVNITGDQGSVDYSKNRDYAINWTHQQSEKARPNSRFSSSVNIVSSKFNQFNPTSASDYLSNTFQSSVAYQTNWDGKYFLTASLNHRQNVITHAFDLTLPELSFSVNRFYPLRSKERVGKPRWYDNISVQYK